MIRLDIFSMSLLLFFFFEARGEARSWLEVIDSKIFGQKPQESHYNEGVELYRQGKKDEAFGRFQLAASGEDRKLRAQALHNSAVIQIEKGELPSARDALKQALAFDNGNRAMEENLAWVEEEIKKRKPEEKDKDKEQNQNESSKDERTAEEKPSKEEKGKEDQPHANEKESDQKTAEDKNQKQGGKASDEKEQAAEEKDQKTASAENEQDKKEEDGKGENSKSKDDESLISEKDEKKPSQSEESLGQKSETPQDRPEGMDERYLVTPEEIKKQEAERLLRSIDDKLGRFPTTDTDATARRRGRDGKDKDW